MTKEYDQWGYEVNKKPNIGKLLSKVVHDWEKERNSFDKKIIIYKKRRSLNFFFVSTNLNSRIFIFFLKCRRGRVFKFLEYSVKRLH